MKKAFVDMTYATRMVAKVAAVAALLTALALPLGAQVSQYEPPQRIDICTEHMEVFLSAPQVAEITEAIDRATVMGDPFNVIRATNVVAIQWSKYATARLDPENPEHLECFSRVLNAMAEQTVRTLQMILVR